ncbi:carbonic anhydrase family protein [Thiomicrorhabdus sp.]|uniref:carbonic anhydrase n=1 Tax=Thiomicrorhabdus sp. TaxID=2039724 RepID=UPI0029C9A7D5|nr:carbonic anhydrase family protein [Thiomicrorhabdus sp.]
MSFRSLSVFVFLTVVLLSPQSVFAGDIDEPLVDLKSEIERLKQHEGGDMPPVDNADSAKSKVPPVEVKQLKPSNQAKKVSTPRVVKSVKPIPSAEDRWSYSGSAAPQNWGKLSEDFRLCSQGKNQSPIDLNSDLAIGSQNLPSLNVHYPPVPMRLDKDSRSLTLSLEPGALMSLGSQNFQLQAISLHTPSEHSLEGQFFPAEMQFWHRSASGELLAAAVFMDIGVYNANLDALLSATAKNDLQMMKNLPAGLVKPLEWLPGITEYYRYNGSMTTPPCSEGVNWVVFKQPIQASVEQIARLQVLIGENARPIQALHSRLPIRSWLQGEAQSLPYEYY